MRKTRILAIGHSYVLSANRATIREVARDSDMDITVAAPEYFAGDLRPVICEPEFSGSPIRLVPIPARWSNQIHLFHYAARPLAKLISQNRFDVIHAWEEPYIPAGYQIARIAHRSGARFCFRTAQSFNKFYPPPFSWFEKKCLAAAHQWVAGSKSVHDNLIDRGYPKDRGNVITLAVDTCKFAPSEETARSAARDKLGLQQPVIGYLGRLVVAKGLRILMRAVERLDPDLPWSLLLIGSGDLRAEIENWATRHNWGRRVRIHLAKHDEVPDYLAAVDILAAPSQTMPNWKEQFGRMLIEAFACAIPVIASDSGEIPNVVGSAGVIVGEKDIEAWAKEMERLIRDESLRKQIGLAGLARVSQFSAAEVALQWRQLYQNLRP